MTDIEDRITRGLNGRANREDPPRTSIETIRKVARRKQQARRNLVLGAATTAAAVIAVGWVVALPDGGDRTAQDPLPADRAQDRSGPDRAGSTDSAFVQSLPEGPPPLVPYLVGNKYRTPDGTVLELAMPGQSGRSGASEVTAYDGGALVADTLFFEGTNGLFQLAETGTTELGPCASGAGATSDDRRTVVWATFTCPESGQQAPLTVSVATAAGVIDTFEVPTDMDRSAITSVAGVVDGSVVLNLNDEVVLANPDGSLQSVPGVGTALDVASGLAIVAGAPGGDRVVDLSTGLPVWTAGPGLLSFSPDGESVLSRAGDEEVVVLDSATGAEVSTFTLPSAENVAQVVWEGNDHLLSSIETPTGTSVLRIALGDEPAIQRAGESFPVGQEVVLSE